MQRKSTILFRGLDRINYRLNNINSFSTSRVDVIIYNSHFYLYLQSSFKEKSIKQTFIIIITHY